MCPVSVVENRTRTGSEDFIARQLSVKTAQLSEWNLSLFSEPRHPHFNDTKRLPQVKCKFLQLRFNSVDDREKFAKAFNLALTLRDRAEQDHKTTIWDAIPRAIPTRYDSQASFKGMKGESSRTDSTLPDESSATTGNFRLLEP